MKQIEKGSGNGGLESGGVKGQNQGLEQLEIEEGRKMINETGPGRRGNKQNCIARNIADIPFLPQQAHHAAEVAEM